MEIHRTYSLEWLDSLVTVTLNPDRPYRSKITEADSILLSGKLPLEAFQVQLELNLKIFSLVKDSHVRHVVTKYHTVITSLRESVITYKENPEFKAETLSGLDLQVISCLEQLISFIEKRFGQYLEINDSGYPGEVAEKESIPKHPRENQRDRVLCTLSGDQIALILRAADETQVLKAKSMNAVFKAIVPHLATPHKDSLSASSIRSKAYNPEETDRDIAVRALESIIKKISGY